MMMEHFGRRLENLREKSGYTKGDISLKLGYSQNVYGAYEREERRPTFETLITLADIYDVSLDYLLRGEEYNQKHDVISNGEKIQEVLTHFKNKGIEEPYILQIEKWSQLSHEDLIEISNHFEWVVHKAKTKNSFQ